MKDLFVTLFDLVTGVLIAIAIWLLIVYVIDLLVL